MSNAVTDEMIEAAMRETPFIPNENNRAWMAKAIAAALPLRSSTALSVHAEPSEWQLVPKKSDVGMLAAWYRYKNGHHFHDEPPPRDTSDVGAWAAMLAAAPIPAAAPAHPPVQEPVVKAIETQEYTLRAMAQNYSGGHSWDHLDGEACTKAVDEIKELRAEVSRIRSALAPVSEGSTDE